MKVSLKKVAHIGLLLLLTDGATVAAAEEVPAGREGGESPSANVMSKTHELISGTLEGTAARIDAFFGQERTYEEATGTYLQWRVGGTWKDGGEIIADNKLRIKLRLPTLQERVRFVFESDPDEEFEEGVSLDSGAGEVLREARDSDNFAAALEVAWQKLEKWSVSASPGVKLTVPLDPFMRFRARRSFEMESWVARFSQKLVWFQSDGWEASTILDFDRPVGEDKLFRATSRVDWSAKDDNFFPGQSFLFYHRLSPRDALSLRAGANGELRPRARATRFALNAGYRRRVYQKWFFAELIPQVVWDRENDFKPTWLLNLRFEALFGAEYL